MSGCADYERIAKLVKGYVACERTEWLGQSVRIVNERAG